MKKRSESIGSSDLLEKGVQDLVADKFLSLETENTKEFLGIMTETISKMINLLQGSEALNGSDKGPQASIGTSEDEVALAKERFKVEEFPSVGESVKDFFANIDDKISPLVSPGAPKYIGHMLPALNISAIIADVVANVMNQNVIAEHVAPSLTFMENQVIGYLADMIGYDQHEASGNIVSGGTTANHTALLVARNKILPDAAESGIHDALEHYNRINHTDYVDVGVITGEDAHYSLEKLAGYVGVGSRKLMKIPYKNGQMDLDELQAVIREMKQGEIEEDGVVYTKQNKILPMAIVANAGSTEKGHVDNLRAISKIAQENGIHFHVDAAHGGGFLVDDEIKQKYFEGIEEADSVTIDGHKMLYTNYSCGGIVFKNKADKEVLKQSAQYVLDTDKENEENHGSYTIEGSRGGSGILQLWSSIRTLGKEGYREIMQHTLKMTQELRRLIEENNCFEIMSGESPLNLVCFRYTDALMSNDALNKLNKEIYYALYEDGEFYVSRTEIDGLDCFRAVPMNLSTQPKHLTALLTKIEKLVSEKNI